MTVVGKLTGMRGWLAAVLLMALASSLAGCTREKFRLRADRESYQIIDQKQHPQWVVPDVSIQPSPASRNFDPADPDHPPLPPDDPAAHVYMNRADGRKGYKHWLRDGEAPSIEYHGWWSDLELNSQGELPLDTAKAVQLGLVDSREYQFELENLYLAALALTFERFEFELKWFGRNTTFYDHFGTSSVDDPATDAVVEGNESNTLATDSILGFTKAFTTGGELLVDFANTFVWEFTGDNTQTTPILSTIGIRFIQPILRFAGRNVRMEALTQAERDVLYALRDFARFRKQFYFDIVSGNNGYLDLLLRLQQIRNLEANLSSLRQNLREHEALAQASIVSGIQVDLVFQSYQDGRLRLIRARNDYQTALDAYKITLGLPPDLPIELDESLLDPFQLTNPALTELEDQIEALLVSFRELDEAPPLEQLQQGFEELSDFTSRVQPLIDQANEDLQQWQSQSESEAAEETGQIQDEADRFRSAQTRLAARLKELATDYQTIRGRIAAALQAVNPNAWEQIQQLSRESLSLVQDVFVIQTQIRAFLIELPEVEYESEEAIQTAMASRLDLMNQRANVVDAWRQIGIAANALKSDLDVFVEADVGTEPGSDNPLKFSSKGSRYRVGVALDGALNRKAERNIYRAELIEYERERRDFIASKDAIIQAIRFDLRELEADRLNFDIARLSLVTAARQVDEARLELLAPGTAGDSSTTRDVLNAFDTLLSAKNALIGIWVRYETQRLQLLLDMGLLQLDERGLQDDDQKQSADGQSTDDGNAADFRATDATSDSPWSDLGLPALDLPAP